MLKQMSTVRAIERGVSELWYRVISGIFVDSVWIHWWGCHRCSERSFFVRRRQFHVCARCTGLIAGFPVSILLLLAHIDPIVFAIFAISLLLDGWTQLVGWRESSNRLRFITGFGSSATLLPALISVWSP